MGNLLTLLLRISYWYAQIWILSLSEFLLSATISTALRCLRERKYGLCKMNRTWRKPKVDEHSFIIFFYIFLRFLVWHKPLLVHKSGHGPIQSSSIEIAPSTNEYFEDGTNKELNYNRTVQFQSNLIFGLHSQIH